jgi:hypothetical protein
LFVVEEYSFAGPGLAHYSLFRLFKKKNISKPGLGYLRLTMILFLISSLRRSKVAGPKK